MQPSPEFQRHHDVQAPQIDRRSAFRPGWRVHTRLDGLLASHAIDPAIWSAACDYRTAWDRIWRLKSSTPTPVRAWGAFRDQGLLSSLAAAQHVRRAEARLVTQNVRLVRACVLEDASWRDLGRRFHVRDVTARSWTIDALCALELAWNAPPGHKQG